MKVGILTGSANLSGRLMIKAFLIDLFITLVSIDEEPYLAFRDEKAPPGMKGSCRPQKLGSPLRWRHVQPAAGYQWKGGYPI
ncbi:MAG: hypothetical protein RDV48_18080 [Candidatus Eremiobacteraeota bacterium]|nr:hypothetical protein [Candidatus Eremiobacteraeota bacterium]